VPEDPKRIDNIHPWKARYQLPSTIKSSRTFILHNVAPVRIFMGILVKAREREVGLSIEGQNGFGFENSMLTLCDHRMSRVRRGWIRMVKEKKGNRGICSGRIEKKRRKIISGRGSRSTCWGRKGYKIKKNKLWKDNEMEEDDFIEESSRQQKLQWLRG
jgi:hypothetical protein